MHVVRPPTQEPTTMKSVLAYSCWIITAYTYRGSLHEHMGLQTEEQRLIWAFSSLC